MTDEILYKAKSETNELLEIGRDDGPYIYIDDDTTDFDSGDASISLPTDPAEICKIVAAILNAAECRLERLVFAEDALKGMHGMTVVKR